MFPCSDDLPVFYLYIPSRWPPSVCAYHVQSNSLVIDAFIATSRPSAYALLAFTA